MIFERRSIQCQEFRKIIQIFAENIVQLYQKKGAFQEERAKKTACVYNTKRYLKRVDSYGNSRVIVGTPDAIRTHDLQSRSLTLYPAELQAYFYPFLNLSIIAHKGDNGKGFLGNNRDVHRKFTNTQKNLVSKCHQIPSNYSIVRSYVFLPIGITHIFTEARVSCRYIIFLSWVLIAFTLICLF